MLFAQQKSDEDISRNKLIGSYCGEEILKNTSKKSINILTHCNAGWLATVDYGTALAPIFFLKEKNIDVHVYVSETRPRNQGAFLTAWELENMKNPSYSYCRQCKWLDNTKRYDRFCNCWIGQNNSFGRSF